MAVRAGMIDRLGQFLGQDLRDLIDRDIVPGSELPNRVATEHLLQLFRTDRHILAIAKPGFDLIAETGLFELGDNGGQAALAAIAEELVHDNREHGASELAERAPEFG